VEDVDDAYEWFFTLCHRAEPEDCAFYADDVKQRFDDLLFKLEKDPAVITDLSAGVSSYRIIAKATLLAEVLDIIFRPREFPSLASNLVLLERYCDTQQLTQMTFSPRARRSVDSGNARLSIEAIDVARRSRIHNLDDFHAMFDEVNETSVYAGRVLALTAPLNNAGLRMVPPESQLFSGESLHHICILHFPLSLSCTLPKPLALQYSTTNIAQGSRRSTLASRFFLSIRPQSPSRLSPTRGTCHNTLRARWYWCRTLLITMCVLWRAIVRSSI
jgi:hypothetical protein